MSCITYHIPYIQAMATQNASLRCRSSTSMGQTYTAALQRRRVEQYALHRLLLFCAARSLSYSPHCLRKRASQRLVPMTAPATASKTSWRISSAGSAN